MWWKRCSSWRRGRADGIGTADGAAAARRGGDAVVGHGVVGIHTIEELQMERCCRLAIDLRLGAFSSGVGHDGRAEESCVCLREKKMVEDQLSRRPRVVR